MELDPGVLSALGAAVGILAQLARAAGIDGKWSSLVGLVASIVVIAVWGYDAGDFRRDTSWEYFSAFLNLNLSALGVYHGVEEAAKAGAKRGLLGLLLAVGLAAGVVTSCRSLPEIPPVPTTVAGADQDVRAGVIKGLGIIEALGKVANRASAIEAELPDYPGRPSVRAGFQRLATTALSTIDAMERGALDTWPALKAAIDPLLADVRRLQDEVLRAGSVVSRLREWLGTIWDLATSIVPSQQALAGGGQ